MVEFEVIDFDGYMCWTRLDDGTYLVDPLYLDEFKIKYCIN